MRKATFEPGLAEKILLYIDSATGWKGGGRGQGKILHPQQKILEKCSMMVGKECKVYISLSIGLCFDFSYKRWILCNEISQITISH